MIKKHKAMTIIEVLIALTLLAIVMITSSAIFAYTFKQTSSAGQISKKTYESKQKLEEEMKNDGSTNATYELFKDAPLGTGTAITSKITGTTYTTKIDRLLNDWTYASSDIDMATFMAFKADNRIRDKEVENKDGQLILDPEKAPEDKFSYDNALNVVYGNPRKSISLYIDPEKLAGFTITPQLIGKVAGKNLLDDMTSSGVKSVDFIENTDPALNSISGTKSGNSYTIPETVEKGVQPLKIKFNLDITPSGQMKPGTYKFVLKYTKGTDTSLNESIIPYKVSEIRVVAGTKEGLLISGDGKTFYTTQEKAPVTALAYGGNDNPLFVMATSTSSKTNIRYSRDGLNWKDVNFLGDAYSWLNKPEIAKTGGEKPIIKKIVYGGPKENKVFMAITNNRVFLSYDKDNTATAMKWGVLKGSSTPYNGSGTSKFGLSFNAFRDSQIFTDIDLRDDKIDETGENEANNILAYLSYKELGTGQADFIRLEKRAGSDTLSSTRFKYGTTGVPYDKIVVMNYNLLERKPVKPYNNDQILIYKNNDSITPSKSALISIIKTVVHVAGIQGTTDTGDVDASSLATMDSKNKEISMIETFTGNQVFMYQGDNLWTFINYNKDEDAATKDFQVEQNSARILPIKAVEDDKNFQVRKLRLNNYGVVTALVGKKDSAVSEIYFNSLKLYTMKQSVESTNIVFGWDLLNDVKYVPNKDLHIDLDKYNVSDVVWR